MTVTAPPPPPSAPVPEVEDIPGVTRRHRLSDLFHERTNFQFIKHSRRWLIISSTLVVVSLLLLGVRGLNLGIDFEGGTSWQVPMKAGTTAKVADVRSLLDGLGFGNANVSVLTPPGGGAQTVRVEAKVIDDPIDAAQTALAKYGGVNPGDVTVPNSDGGTFTFTAKPGVKPTVEGVTNALASTQVKNAKVKVDGQVVTITVPKLPVSQVQTVAAALAKYAGSTVTDVSITTVGPTWGHEVSNKALKALIIFFFVLAAYLAIRFEWKMSAAAIVAVIHDIIFTIGVYALFQFQVSPATVTAFLTILGFSLYDTVVVFDKVGEFQKTLTATGRSTYSEMVNRSLNAVLMRSVSTSLVALLPVVSLLIVGSGHPRRDRARRLRPRAGRRSVHRFVLVDLRRRAAARVVEGTRAAVQGSCRSPPPGQRSRRRAGARRHARPGRDRYHRRSWRRGGRRHRRRTHRRLPRHSRAAGRAAPDDPGPAPPTTRARSASSDATNRRPGSRYPGYRWTRLGSRSHVRDVLDYPKPGIVFKDITPLLAAPDAFRAAVDALAEPFARHACRQGHRDRGARASCSRRPSRTASRPVSCPCASPGSCRGRSSARNTCSSTAPTSSRSTATRSRRGSTC